MKKTLPIIILTSTIFITNHVSAYVVYSQGQVVYPQQPVVVVQQQPQYTTVAQPQPVVVQQPAYVPQTVVVQQPAYVQPTQTVVVNEPSTTEVVVGSIAPIIRAITPLVVDHPRYTGWYQPHHPRPLPQRVYRSAPPRYSGHGAPMPPPPPRGRMDNRGGGNPPRR